MPRRRVPGGNPTDPITASQPSKDAPARRASHRNERMSPSLGEGFPAEEETKAGGHGRGSGIHEDVPARLSSRSSSRLGSEVP